MSGRVLVFQHYPGSPAGLFTEEAAARGIGFDVIDAETGCTIPDDAMASDGLLILGGAMGANDDHVCAHFPDLLELARAFGSAGKPVLGVCLGGQLLARAFGGRVHSDRFGEFGFRPTRATPAAAEDPLLAGLELPVPLMQWHDDSFDLPPEATLLLEGEPCPAQGFRVGDTVWGFQCHLEVTRTDAEAWGDLRARIRNQPEAPELVRRHLEDGWPATEAFGRAVAGRWLDLCRR